MKELSELERELESTKLNERDIWQRIKDAYFKPKDIEKWNNGRIYEWIGVKYFKQFVTKLKERTSGKRTQRNYFLESLSEKGLRDFVNQTRYNEGMHLLSTICLSFSTASFLANKNYGMAALWGTLDIALGIYPIILQRYNRTRIEDLLDRMKSK